MEERKGQREGKRSVERRVSRHLPTLTSPCWIVFISLFSSGDFLSQVQRNKISLLLLKTPIKDNVWTERSYVIPCTGIWWFPSCGLPSAETGLKAKLSSETMGCQRMGQRHFLAVLAQGWPSWVLTALDTAQEPACTFGSVLFLCFPSPVVCRFTFHPPTLTAALGTCNVSATLVFCLIWTMDLDFPSHFGFSPLPCPRPRISAAWISWSFRSVCFQSPVPHCLLTLSWKISKSQSE